MKKTLFLSVVASTLIMAGGDIAPVKPAVATPAAPAAPTAVSGWDFSGQGVVYYQTADKAGTLDLFEQESAAADAGIQLRAVNKDLFAGIGAGVEVNGLTTLGLEHKVVSNVMEGFGDKLKGGWISQAYLTYGIGNTNLKLGRQELPKALSPFAFSESWNVFKNTFDAALVVNTDIPNTTLVGAWVHAANSTVPGAANDISDFAKLNNSDGVYMLTAQNKSIEGLTLTGTYYYAPDMLTTEDVNVLWGDAKFAVSNFTVALQGGTILGQDDVGGKDTTAYGAKVGTKFGMFGASVAYSSVDDGTLPIHNLGTGVKTPLYTQMLLNQGVIKSDADYVKAGVSADVLGGKFMVDYGYAVEKRKDDVDTGSNPAELDVIFKTKVFNDSTTLLAAYVNVDPDEAGVDSTNVVRVWARYNF